MPGPIRFDGVISGINYAGIIEQFLTVERLPIQTIKTRIGQETQRKTAYLEVSATLLGLKGATDKLAVPSFFSRTTVKSSREDVLLATGEFVGSTGAFTFTSARLARTQQAVSSGFASASSKVSPNGQGSVLRLETGNGFVDRVTRLSDLNGGTGVDRGKIRITDRVGGTAIVDLTSAVTVQDVVDRINGQSTANVRASVAGDRLLLEDRNVTAAGGSLIVENVGDDSTATDLGIEGTRSAGAGETLSFFGGQVQRVAGTTLLQTLNDGLGVRRNGAGSADFTITRTDATSFTVDLDENDTTLQSVIDKINAAGGGTVTAAINAEGNGLELVDSSGGGGLLSVATAGTSNAALDLGLLQTAELKGDAGAAGANVIQGARLIAGLNSILRRTLNGGSSEFHADGGPFLGDRTGVGDGSVSITDRSGASATIDLVTRSYRSLDAAAAAGSTTLDLDSLSGVAVGNRIRLVDAVSGATELRSVKRIVDPGTGTIELDQATTVALGAGSKAIAQNENLTDLQNQFRNAVGVKVDLRLNRQGTGFLLADVSGGTASALRLADAGGGSAAADLGVRTEFTGTADSSTATTFTDDALIGLPDDYFNGATASVLAGGVPTTRSVLDFDGVTGKVTLAGAALPGAVTTYTLDAVNASTFTGRDVDAQYLGERTLLAGLNQGAGVFAGKIRITDTNGTAFNVDLSQATDNTILAVIRDINGAAGAAGSGVTARINDTGDGLLLLDTTPGAGTLRVEESGGTTARDLGILGVANGATPDRLDGSFERTFAITATTTVQNLVDAIQASGLPITATLVNDGSGIAPNRISLISRNSGSSGRFGIETDVRSLSFDTTSRAADAVLLYGIEGSGSDPTVLTSSTNTFRNVVPGLTLDLVSTSADPATVTVNRDLKGVVDQVRRLASSYNGFVDKVRELTRFDTVTEAKGILFGDSTLRGIERSLGSLLSSPVRGIPTSSLNTLAEIGLRLGKTGRLTLDEATLQQALDTRFDEVKDLFTRPRRVEPTTPLKDLNEGRGVKESPGDDFTVFTRSGASFTVDLAGSTDIQGVLNAINLAAGNGGKVVATILADGTGLQLTDTTAPTGSDDFKVTAVGSSSAAAELGIQSNVGPAVSTLRGLERLLLRDPGAAPRLSERLLALTDDPGGPIANRTEGFDKKINGMNDSIERIEKRVLALEQRLVRQFTQLETFLGEMESTRNTLNNQLTRLLDGFKRS